MHHRFVYKNGQVLTAPYDPDSNGAYHYDLWQRMGLPWQGKDKWAAGYYDDRDDSIDLNDGDERTHPDEIYRAVYNHLYPEHTANYFFETVASDTYTGPDIQVVHVPTGDQGEPHYRIPGIYDSYNNIFYHGDQGGNHLPLLSHIYEQPQEDWNYAEWHKPVIFMPHKDGFAWHETIKPAIVQQMYDGIHQNIPNLNTGLRERGASYGK